MSNAQDRWLMLTGMAQDPAFLLSCRREIDDLAEGVMSLVFGRCLGAAGRVVYDTPICPDRVIKVAVHARHIDANRKEWQFWQGVRDTEHSRWVAPCHSISECGRFLIMERAEALSDEAFDGLRVPENFFDNRRSNWGLLHGEPVAVDYERYRAAPGQPLFGQVMRNRIQPWAPINSGNGDVQ